MKIRNYLTILFAIISIFVLLCLAGFLTYINTDDSNTVKQTITNFIEAYVPEDIIANVPKEFLPQKEAKETDTAANNAAVTAETEIPSTEVKADTASTSADTPVSVSDHSIIFVGDSRTVSMGKAVNDSCTYIGEDGEGYHWFASTGITELRKLIEADPLQTVVYNLGVNDPENINVYIDVYKTLESEFTDTKFYYLSVNPLSDDADLNTTNEMIELFNKTLKNAFPDQYIDSYTYLKEKGFDTVDGLHYTEPVSVEIHDFVVDSISKK